MEGQGIKCHILHKKEIENYSLTLNNLVRAIRLRQSERSITTNMLIDALPKDEIPSELVRIIMELDTFCTKDATPSKH
jgi:hypothetical protein